MNESQRRRVRRNTYVLGVSTELHKQSRTRGGKNRKLIPEDSLDLKSAAKKDMDRYREIFKREGYDLTEIEEAFEKLDEANKKLGLYR